MDRAWAGVDIGKQHHHAVVVDAEGTGVLSWRVTNDQAALEELIGQVSELAAAVTWAVDLHSSEAALVVALLLAHGQTVVYVPGVTVNRAASAYRGAGKTDLPGEGLAARLIADLAEGVLALDEQVKEVDELIEGARGRVILPMREWRERRWLDLWLHRLPPGRVLASTMGNVPRGVLVRRRGTDAMLRATAVLGKGGWEAQARRLARALSPVAVSPATPREMVAALDAWGRR